MKRRIIKSLIAMLLTVVSLPMIGQDFLSIYFKDGTFRIFHLKSLVELYTSPYDSYGIQHMEDQYQHVKTQLEEFVYDINDIDSISFTKYDEYKVEKNMANAMKSILPELSHCESAGSVSDKIDLIKRLEGVETAWVEGDALFVKIKDWEIIIFEFNNAIKTNVNKVHSTSKKMKAMNVNPNRLKKSDGSSYKAVIANQEHYDENECFKDQRNDYMYPLKEKLEKAGFDVDYLPSPEKNLYVDLDFFYSNMYNYDVVYLCAHGGYSESTGHRLLTGHTFGKVLKDASNDAWPTESQKAVFYKDYLKIFDDYRFAFSENYMYLTYHNEPRLDQDGKYRDYWVSYVALRESFFEHTGNISFSNPNSLFFATSCQSLKANDNLANYLIKYRKLGTYVGYTESNYYGPEVGCTMLMNMADGISLSKACSVLGDFDLSSHGKAFNQREDFDDGSYIIETVTGTYKDEDITKTTYDRKGKVKDNNHYIASVKMVPENNPVSGMFIIPTITEMVNHEEVMNDYNKNSTVLVMGITTTSNPISLWMGFEYGENEHNLTERVISDTQFNVIPNNKGNYAFASALKGLERGKTYYYRAYSYDGMNYNYGNTFSFYIDKLKDLELSTGSFCIINGESTTIDITGNGEYDIFNGNDKVTKVTLEGEKLIIEAIGAGESTIIVTDKKTGNTAPLEVTVWARLSVAIIGNIDLEVGASAEVRIMSGNGDYKLESSDPNVATPSLVGEFVKVDALSAGTATITVTDNKTGQTASFTVTIAKPAPIDIPADAIDLGLPSGTLWASYNVGATNPEEYGGYYAWGEIKEKDVYFWTTYIHCDGVSNSCHNIGDDISGTEFDVAHVRWGGEWQMPTAEDFKELIYKCDHKVTSQNGVYGFKFTGPNGNSIFLPAAGYHFNSDVNKVGSGGEYWSSTIRENKNYAYDASMSADYVYWDCYINRFAGLPVRPVKKSGPALEDLVLSSTSPVSLKAGETYAVQIISGNGIYTFDNTSPKVATFETNGNTINILAIKAGSTTITVKDTKSLQTATIKVTVSGTTNDIPADVIDLGLKSGKKWASYNVGALCPEDYGGYFAWGETETKESYTEDNYIANVDLTKEYITVISGTEQDAARIHWGENWRMPTILEIRELLRECTSKWDTVNGVKGRRFIGPNGNSIFLPAAGAYYAYGNYYEGEDGRYWSAEQVWDGTKAAFYLSFSSTGVSGENRSTFDVGMPIRPIYCGDTDHLVDFKLSSIDPVCLPVGESHTIEIMSGNNSYTILSSDESVATVGQGGWASIEQGTSGKSIVISAVATGVSIVTAFDNMSGQKFTIAVKVIDPNSTINIIGHEAVDLGLPSGTLWATNNIGAEKEENYGEYYAWGETAQKDEYYSHTYDFSADKNDENSCVFLGDIAGTEFDVAHVKWGGLWRMPTHEQVKELIENCESWVTKHNGVTGILFKGPNGKRIFLPAAGFRGNSNIYSQGESSQYWTSTPDATNANTVYTFYTMNIQNPSQVRYLGLSVRPVANNGNDLVNLTLSDDYIRLNVGENGSIDITSGNGHYSVTSSDANIATAKVQSWHSIEKGTSGISIVIDALSVGEVTIFVTDNNCGQTRRIEVKIVNINLNGHEAIDLGLTSGTMWATCNVGAASPEEFGGFYAWGETMEKESYSWGTYTHCDGAYSSCHNIGEDISGSEYDVAHVKWGGSWKTPNETQVNELLDECSSEWTSVNDVNGYRFTGPNGKSIFIPAAGYYENSRHYRSGKAGGYWMSSQDSKPNYVSDIIVFEKDYVEITTFERYYGLSIRPIVE